MPSTTANLHLVGSISPDQPETCLQDSRKEILSPQKRKRDLKRASKPKLINSPTKDTISPKTIPLEKSSVKKTVGKVWIELD